MKINIPSSLPATGLISRDGDDNTVVYRTGDIVERASGDSGENSLELSVSSTTPYCRWGRYHEILDHSPKSVDLRYIRRDGKILVDHSSNRVDAIVGRVDKCWLDGDVCRVRMTWDDSDRANEVRRLVEKGMLRTVSIGYRVLKWKESERDDGGININVTRWELLEVSFVAVPADSSVGVGRAGGSFNYVENSRGDVMPEGVSNKSENNPTPPAPPAPDVGRIQEEARKDEQDRIRAIMSVGEEHDLEELAREAVSTGESYASFNKKALGAIAARNDERKTREPHKTGDVDLTPDEISQFSLRRLCLAQQHGQASSHWKNAAYERAVCDAAYSEMPSGHETRGNVVPDRVLSGVGGALMPGLGYRAPIDTGSTTTGAALVGDNLMAGSFVEFLYSRSILQRLGITMLPGLVGNVEIPRQATKASPGSVAEGAAAPESILTLDQIAMSAKHVAVQGSYTRNMMLQSTPAVENLIRMDFARSMALHIDYLGIHGSGASNQPRGVKNTAGINTVAITTDGQPSWEDLVSMVKKIKEDNAVTTPPQWVFDSTTWEHLVTTVKTSSSTTVGFMIDADMPSGVLVGLPYETTELLGSAQLMLGCWDQLICGEWGGLDVMTDPYTQGAKGNTNIYMFKSIDFACRHPESFCVGT